MTYGFASEDGITGALKTVQTTVQFAVRETNGWLWIADPPAIGGLSGGPMLSERGSCVGMQTGYVSEGDARVIFMAADKISSSLVQAIEDIRR